MKSTTKPCKNCQKQMPKWLNNCCSDKCSNRYKDLREKEKRKTVREKKSVSIKILTNKADIIFSRYIRTRDSLQTTLSHDKCVCITCLEVVDNIQCWHFVSRASRSTRWEEKNANGQCPACNCWGWGRQYEHGLAIDLKYWSWIADILIKLWHEPEKMTREFLEGIIGKFTTKFAELWTT